MMNTQDRLTAFIAGIAANDPFPKNPELIPVANETSFASMTMDCGVSDCCQAPVIHGLLHTWCSNCGENCNIELP